MKRVLLVDDDAVLTRAYRDRLSAHGFQVNTVGSGTGALIFLESAKPDLMVLDLMMPEVTGVDVLQFVRGQPRLAATPVVVLANELRDNLGRHAARIGIQKAFRKDQCSPSVLMAAIDEILQPIQCTVPSAECRVEGPSEAEALECTVPSAKCKVEEPPEPAVLECKVEIADRRVEMAQDGTGESRVEARAGFLADAPATCGNLGELSAALAREPLTGPEQQEHLQDLFLKIRFLAEMAHLTGLAVLAQATAAFDALLHALMASPERLGPCALRTIESFVETVRLLFEKARESRGGTPLSARVLVVDDDPVANQMAVAALGRVQLNACSTEDSVVAWQWINSGHFDLVLLRMEMPVLNGLQLCERLRRVPGYEKTPVIFVSDVDTGATSALMGADDLLAKPILPQELAVRVMMHLVRATMQARSGKDGIGSPQSTELVDEQFAVR